MYHCQQHPPPHAEPCLAGDAHNWGVFFRRAGAAPTCRPMSRLLGRAGCRKARSMRRGDPMNSKEPSPTLAQQSWQSVKRGAKAGLASCLAPLSPNIWKHVAGEVRERGAVYAPLAFVKAADRLEHGEIRFK